MSEQEFQANKLLGSTKKSYAFKSDGKVLNGNSTGEEFGPKFERNDVIGCGLIMQKKQIFFTLNGRFLGTPFANVEINLESVYPSVCLQAVNEEIATNFSGSSLDPFVYDLEGLVHDL
jgi:Ran-binding protein 9/10